MENSHKYFKRDISWLSFNYRVLLEAEDETLPIYERIKFLSIYSSNLEEFYEIRVAEHRGVIMKKNFTEESGVEIDLIVRGICCLVPNRPFSANIRVTRIVDMFLEHSRIWYFYNDGEEDLFLTSADWMRRNLNRRIETAFPILNAEIKQCIIDILKIQLQDNVKACLIDEHLHNNFKRDDNPVKVRAQLAIYEYLKNKM